MPPAKLAPQTFALPSLALLPKEDSGNAQSVSVPALVMVEGTQTSASGVSRTYNKALLEQIVKASNDRLSQGRRCKVFASLQDHSYSQSATIGYVSGNFELKPITSELLPHPGMTELIGKLGIFCEVAIAGESNVQQYHDGRLKELSVGIDFGGKFAGVKNAIYEISAVAFPAVAGATLYNLPLEQKEIYTMGDLLKMLEDAIASGAIDGTAPEVIAMVEAAKKMAAAPTMNAADAPAPVPAVHSKKPEVTQAEVPDTYAAKISALEEQVARYQREKEAGDRLSQLRTKGEALRSSGKMAPAQFNDLFGNPDLAAYSTEGNQDLERLAFHLEQVEKYAQPIAFGLQTNNEPLPEQVLYGQQADAEAKEYLDRHPVKAPY